MLIIAIPIFLNRNWKEIKVNMHYRRSEQFRAYGRQSLNTVITRWMIRKTK